MMWAMTSWGIAWFDSIGQDLRYGLRQLNRNRGFAATAILTAARKDLYRLLESEVAPLYYSRDGKGVPTGWVELMRRALRDPERGLGESGVAADEEALARLPAR